MNAASPNDYLGHPCKLSQVHDLIDDIPQVRRSFPADADPRDLPRSIGVAMRNLLGRLTHTAGALEAILEQVPDDTGGVRALLDMASEYSRQADIRFHELAAKVMVALERGPGYPDHLKPGADGGEA
jgi:hypothetical protein